MLSGLLVLLKVNYKQQMLLILGIPCQLIQCQFTSGKFLPKPQTTFVWAWWARIDATDSDG